MRAGGLMFTSGQLPLRGGELVARGKLGRDVTPVEGYECAQQCAINALTALRAELGELALVKRVVKVVVFVASERGFIAQPSVANGASELLEVVFGEAGRHARSAVGVSVLPFDAPVEVELVVAV